MSFEDEWDEDKANTMAHVLHLQNCLLNLGLRFSWWTNETILAFIDRVKRD